MYPDLKGKVAVVTGGSSGIGAAIAQRFAEEGIKVIINYYNDREEAELIADSIVGSGGEAVIVKGDVREESTCRELLDAALTRFGALDIWVNNAGIQKECPAHKMDIELWNDIIGTNLTGVFLGCREALKHYVTNRSRGVIVNVSSVHEIMPWAGFAHYCASKGGVKLLTQSLALEYGPLGIRINSIAPGGIDTPINAQSMSDPEQRKRDEAGIPLRYIGTAQEMANVAAWLASSQSSYVTGATIIADGGLSLYPACNSEI